MKNCLPSGFTSPDDRTNVLAATLLQMGHTPQAVEIETNDSTFHCIGVDVGAVHPSIFLMMFGKTLMMLVEHYFVEPGKTPHQTFVSMIQEFGLPLGGGLMTMEREVVDVHDTNTMICWCNQIVVRG